MKTAVLAMAYGTPSGPDEVLEFYTDVRAGRAPTDEQLKDLERRYRAIGGVSPLNERSRAQIAGIQRSLDVAAPDQFRVFYATKHSTPKIEAQIESIASLGFKAVVGLVLAPHYSSLSVGEYIARARKAAEEHHMSSSFIERWGAEGPLVEALAARLEEAIATLGHTGANFEVIFSAHSLPERILELGDPYPDELKETARLVAERVGLKHYRTGWQSAGRTAEPWLGPDLLILLGRLKDEGFDGVVVCPAGFVSDHLEVLYDLDIEARTRADELGIEFIRTRSLNDDASIADLLSRRVIDAVANMHVLQCPE